MRNVLMTAPLTHLQSMLLFALIISLAFGTLGRRRPIERLKYAAWSFSLFLLIGILIGWAMYPFSR
jgi:putative Mn2+ efflux pump MntP